MAANGNGDETGQQAPNVTIFEEVLIFTGRGFIENGFVVVEGGRIARMGSGPYPDADDYSLKTAQRISRPGCTLLPGLIDCHLHGLFGNERCIEESLRFGVTTVMDMHNEPHHIRKLQQLARQDKKRFADFLCCGSAATVDGGWPAPVVLAHGRNAQALETIESWPKLRDPSQADDYVQKQVADSGASYVKIMHEVGDTLALPSRLPEPNVAVWQSVVRAAHSRGLIAVGHAFSHRGALGLLRAGVDGLTHIWMDEPFSDELLALMKQHGAHCCPTLSCIASQTKQGHALRTNFTQDPFAQKMLFDPTPRQALGLGNEKASIKHGYNHVRRLYRAGVPLIAGSDASGQVKGQAYGLTLHMELWQMVHEIGMAPIDVLQSVTSVTADRFGLKDRGWIRQHYKADFTLIQGDVRELLSDRKVYCLPVCGVWRDGVLAMVYE